MERTLRTIQTQTIVLKVTFSESPRTSLKLLELTEKKLPETFKNIGKNEFVTDLERIQNFIAKKGSVTRKELLTEFKSVAEPEKLVSLIGGLIATEDIKLVNK